MASRRTAVKELEETACMILILPELKLIEPEPELIKPKPR
jgi:hypothetical protein